VSHGVIFESDYLDLVGEDVESDEMVDIEILSGG
jgi:hypothetical protein